LRIGDRIVLKDDVRAIGQRPSLGSAVILEIVTHIQTGAPKGKRVVVLQDGSLIYRKMLGEERGEISKSIRNSKIGCGADSFRSVRSQFGPVALGHR